MVKSLRCHEVRAVLNSQALLAKIKRDLGNQIRGLLKNLGLIIGKAQGNVCAGWKSWSAVILHRRWREGTDFQWSTKGAAA